MALGEMAAAGGGRRSVNSEINMVPMIDLLVCCITFLILTAVWATWGRMPVDPQARGGPMECEEGCRQKAVLHVIAERPESFTLAWRQGTAVLRTVDVPRQSEGGRYRALAEAVKQEWATKPAEAPQSPRAMVSAVLHVDHRTSFGDMAAVLDALQAPKIDIPGTKHGWPAFAVQLAN